MVSQWSILALVYQAKTLMKSSNPSHLTPEMANLLPPTPNLLQLQNRFLLPLPLPLSLCQSVRKCTMLRTPRLYHQSLSPSSVQNRCRNRNQSQKTSLSQRHCQHHHLRRLSRTFPSPSSPAFQKRCTRVRWPRGIAHRKAERNAIFGSFGAIRAEATLRELDPRRSEQRRGDSDVDWDGSMSRVAEVEDSEEGDGGMLVDQKGRVGLVVLTTR